MCGRDRNRGEAAAAAEQRVAIIQKLYARDDLPPALQTVREEAMRAAYIHAAIYLGTPNRPEERFVFSDRLQPTLLPRRETDYQGEVIRQEAMLRQLTDQLQRNEAEARRAQQALLEAHEELRRLHGEVARRDELLAAKTSRQP